MDGWERLLRLYIPSYIPNPLRRVYHSSLVMHGALRKLSDARAAGTLENDESASPLGTNFSYYISG